MVVMAPMMMTAAMMPPISHQLTAPSVVGGVVVGGVVVGGVVEAYRRECRCRKPSPGMIERGGRDFDIDLKQSFLIGDHCSDVEAGRRAGCRTVLLDNGSSDEEEMIASPDRITRDLPEAVDWILTVCPREEAKVHEQ